MAYPVSSKIPLWREAYVMAEPAGIGKGEPKSGGILPGRFDGYGLEHFSVENILPVSPSVLTRRFHASAGAAAGELRRHRIKGGLGRTGGGITAASAVCVKRVTDKENREESCLAGFRWCVGRVAP